MTSVTISDHKAIFNVAACKTGAVHLLPPRCYCRRPKGEARHGRNRRAVRAEDLSEEAIAAIEASGMEPGLEHLDAELDPAGTSVVEVGVDFARKLRARGDAGKERPADKAFRDSLFDDS
jgi:hypothetical protein